MARRAPLTVSIPPTDEADLEALRHAVAVGLEQAKQGELLDGEEIFRSLEDLIRSKPDPAE